MIRGMRWRQRVTCLVPGPSTLSIALAGATRAVSLPQMAHHPSGVSSGSHEVCIADDPLFKTPPNSPVISLHNVVPLGPRDREEMVAPLVSARGQDEVDEGERRDHALLGRAEPYHALLGRAEPYHALRGRAELYHALRGRAELYHRWVSFHPLCARCGS
jgi:hypothetical protein